MSENLSRAMKMGNMVSFTKHITRFILTKTSEGNSQISLNVPMQKLQEKEEKRPAYHYPTKDQRRAHEMFLVAQALSGSLSCIIKKKTNKKFARDIKGISRRRRYADRDVSYQQDTASCSSFNTDITVPESASPYTNENPYLYEMDSLRDGPPLSLDPSNSAFCESLDEFAILSTIETEQACMIAFTHEEHDTASFPDTATTGPNLPSPTASRSEPQFNDAYRDTYGQVGLTAWPSTLLPIRNRTIPNNLLDCMPNKYGQMPEFCMDFVDLPISHSDHSSELAAEELRWQSQMSDDAVFGANWPLSEFDRLLCITEGV